MDLRKFSSAKEKREQLEKVTKTSLSNIGYFSLDETAASSRNCENMIGVTQIPLGVAGPLALHTQDHMLHECFLPLATTEGALVASINRGCKAITLSGGATVDAERIGATRGPVFYVKDIAEGRKLEAFLTDNLQAIKEIAESTSKHVTLLKFEIAGSGRYRFVRFYFDTQDAMGMNMVTIATGAIVDFVEEKTKISCLSLSGNYCADKKPSMESFLHGRGFVVRAEVLLRPEVVKTLLKTSPQAIHSTWLAKCMVGSSFVGSLSYTAQSANVVAALFLSTGQDIGHVSEGSMGMTTTELVPTPEGDALYMSSYIPDLMIGTVGGGTSLATQKEALNLLGVAGGDGGQNAQRLAGIVGGAVLAGEISLLASLSEGSLVQAHERLARGKPV